ncbi:hypothetical protein GOP47_0021886 [Adiantum capillus-veneris]|uniref:Rab-GAP TBC domain-containing protein n=1 Tax=Adiantum capillus-veneris TaxID=13818 RepID=A0A9D4Z6M0_ADICA|nr:hypothetical protein GOP47_0021886 [Adiantum capillus-veneris]
MATNCLDSTPSNTLIPQEEVTPWQFVEHPLYLVDAWNIGHSFVEANLSYQGEGTTSKLSVQVDGVAVTVFVGVPVGMAIGATLLYISRTRMPPKRPAKKGLPLSRKQWRDAFDPETGRLIDGEKVLQKVRRGGVDATIRAEVWPFLLNFFDFESTLVQREAEKLVRREEYDDLVRCCKIVREKVTLESRGLFEKKDAFENVNPDSQHVFDVSLPALIPTDGSLLLEHRECADKSLNSPMEQDKLAKWEEMSVQAKKEFTMWQRIMRLDAIRMNAEWVAHSPSQASVTKGAATQLALDVGLKEDLDLEPCLQHHAARLVSILEVYALFDPETGYCQGMGELLSPFVALLDEDYQAFWCFSSFMHVVRHNFRLDEVGIQRQLKMVSKILKLCDPQLYKHLELIEAVDCFFIYRMVVILMRRELSFEQTIFFWEILWADKTAARLDKVKISCRKGKRKAPPTEDLLLYVITAAVRQKRRLIMEKCRCMDDVLKECNSMSGNLDVWALLDDARDLVASFHHKLPV